MRAKPTKTRIYVSPAPPSHTTGQLGDLYVRESDVFIHLETGWKMIYADAPGIAGQLTLMAFAKQSYKKEQA
jgi:hypothetical protein